MNIFEIYLEKIKNLIKKLNNEKLIILPESLNVVHHLFHLLTLIVIFQLMFPWYCLKLIKNLL